MAKIYLYTDGNTFDIPNNYTIEYKKDNEWLPVKIKETIPAKATGNTVNSILFYSISTTSIK